ncbi:MULTISPECIES: DUF5131 family protein [Streptomyces]|uniref:Phage protein Gp37/Gp68 n=1 Tax=Streptomyces fradiae ATCC 10745 = DSM 40063 TaxID=1319510 RepID=A0A1Y2NNW9_STRFR|nr:MULTISPECIES: DUF5131 family protein [Streptomyces]KAF0646579.1 hypothetical protein K701_27915 [Streptomyces fradiae ATCC 10745 = DSM 40063]OSY49204.1 Phage protein Gp37/Gp68 [Streptomyces fradiae ATCC 10745 = DSM 40063]
MTAARLDVLRNAVRTQHGEWTTHHVLHLYTARGLRIPFRGTARRDLTRLATNNRQQPDMVYDALNQRYGVPGRWQAETSARVDWVIVGGESGRGARPMAPQWATSLRDQCAAADVPYFFKQWGEYAPTGYLVIGSTRRGTLLAGDPVDDLGHRVELARVGKKTAGRELDGRTHDAYPKAP